ncbi:MAG: aminoacyl-tRNA hydrolase [Patescibacteria group bacterium]
MKVKLVIGLGNPGKEYYKTYHNVGFLIIDFLKIPKFKTSASKKFEYAKINDLILIKPLFFMNESGKAVLDAIKYFKIKPEEILAVHDDSDIELGKYKLSFGRASAGHNGVESIIQSLKTKNFWRLRIGIRKISNNSKRTKAGLPAEARRAKAGEFVLRKISASDMKIFNILLPSLAHGLLSPLSSPAIQRPRPR